MCVLIYKPAGTSVSESILRGCFDRNDDGLGIGHSDGSTLHIWRTLTNIDEACKRAALLNDYPAMIHFRYATHGTVSMENVHPFWINDTRRALVGHNGIIQIGTQAGESDTRSFVSNVLANMRDGWWNNHIARTQIEKLLGGSRLAIMEEDGKCTFLNKAQGETTADGVWFSNGQFKQFVDPSLKHGPAADIVAATGLAAPRQSGFHYAGTQYALPHRDPFQSRSAVVPTPPTGTMTTSALPNTTPMIPTQTKQTQTLHSVPSRAGGMVSPSQSNRPTPTTFKGPLHDSEVQAWTESLGVDWINDYAIGFVSMPNGVYGREEYHCEQHVPADVRGSLEPTVSAINAIDLIDAHFTGAKCCQCHVLLTAAARQEYHDFMNTVQREEEDELPPISTPNSRSSKKRKEAKRKARTTAASESESLELAPVLSDAP
jgi:glutamine amidotransferase